MAEGWGRWARDNPEGTHPQVPVELALRCTVATFGSSVSPLGARTFRAGVPEKK